MLPELGNGDTSGHAAQSMARSGPVTAFSQPGAPQFEHVLILVFEHMLKREETR